MGKSSAKRQYETESNPVGRPSLYLPEMCDLVIKFGTEGYSKAEMAAALGVVRNTLDNWASDHPEFLSALSRAYEESLAWWEKQGRTNLNAASFQASLYAKAMAGRFPQEAYRNQLALTGADGGAIKLASQVDVRLLSDDERELLRELLARAAARQLEGPDVIEGEYSEVDEGGE